MKTDQQLRDKVTAELNAVIDYRSSEAITHVVALLDALMATYQAELVTIDAAQLARKQGAAMQVKALYDCIVNPARGKSPRV
jgi:flagellar biosynthesis regulator FlaF